jgi:hypothetical protein
LRRADGTSVQRASGWTCIRAATRHLALVLPLFIAGAYPAPGQAYAQGLQPDDQPGTVRGVVVNAVTLAPISRALVYSPDNHFATLTDGEGHFEFALPKAVGVNEGMTFFEGQPYQIRSGGAGGQVSLFARKPGFLDDPNGMRQAQAAPDGEITIPLLPEALIKGRVVVSEADPVLGVTVQLWSKQVQDGMPRWVHSSAVRADSSGEFRFAELLPGSYKVFTNESMDNDPVTTIPGGQLYGFPPVYFPGVSDFGAAGSITLTAGQTAQIDLPLARQPYYPVKIPVANPDQSGGMNITVSVQGHRGPGYSLGYNAGKQTIEGSLPNGNYLVEATTYGQPSTTGAVNLAVAGAPAEGPGMTLIQSSSVVVHVSEEFTSTESNGTTTSTWTVGGRSFPVHGPRLYLQIRLEKTGDFEQQQSELPRSPTGPNDDSLVIENLTPGRYWLRVPTSRGYVAAATMGGVDLLHEPLVVAAGSSTPIDIKMRDDAAEIDGTVTGMKTDPNTGPGTPATPVFLYCVPLPDSSGQYQQLGASVPDGTFISDRMAPGTYRVLAFKNPQPHLPYRDAEAMKAYDTLGPVVHLSPGQKTTVQVPIISSSE